MINTFVSSYNAVVTSVVFFFSVFVASYKYIILYIITSCLCGRNPLNTIRITQLISVDYVLTIEILGCKNHRQTKNDNNFYIYCPT